MYMYSGTSDNGGLYATAIWWSATNGESSGQNYGQTLIKNPPHSGHLQSTATRPLDIDPMSDFTSINSQAGNLLQKNERKTNKSLFFYLGNARFLKIITF